MPGRTQRAPGAQRATGRTARSPSDDCHQPAVSASAAVVAGSQAASSRSTSPASSSASGTNRGLRRRSHPAASPSSARASSSRRCSVTALSTSRAPAAASPPRRLRFASPRSPPARAPGRRRRPARRRPGRPPLRPRRPSRQKTAARRHVARGGASAPVRAQLQPPLVPLATQSLPSVSWSVSGQRLSVGAGGGDAISLHRGRAVPPAPLVRCHSPPKLAEL